MPLHGLSDQFLATVATSHRWKTKVEVHAPNGALLEDISEFVTGGSVSVDETREFRRTLSMSVQGTTDLIPFNLTDLLHPASSNELYVYRGVEYPDTTTEFAQLGVFRMTKPNISDDGANITFAVSGQDRASVIARIAWEAPYVVAAYSTTGLSVAQVIQAAMSTRYPGLDYSQLDPQGTVNFSYPGVTWGQNPSSGGGDPMSDFITFAANAGAELFFDVQGRPVLRLIRNPLTTQVIDSVHFVEGENCVVDTAQRTLDESTAFNGLILYCNGNGAAQPFSVEVWDTNPASPTYYLGPWGKVPYTMTTLLIPADPDDLPTATSKAIFMASQQLQLILGTFDDVSLTCVPNPALQEGDCLAVARGRLKIDANYVISSMTIPLDPETSQAISFRPRIYVGTH